MSFPPDSRFKPALANKLGRVFILVLTWAPALPLLAWNPPEAVTAWKFNDPTRPLPAVVEPLPESTLVARSTPPPGAEVLFSGDSLSSWNPTKWKIGNGILECVPGSGSLTSIKGYGSCRLHLEWSTPSTPPLKTGQNRGNSGIFFMGKYEVQILDTFDNPTYADGIAGAVYGQYPPTVNPIRPPGQWQFYDIEFHRPVFDATGLLIRPATLTVDFNGHRVQDRVELTGPTNPPGRKPYQPHPDALPISIQDHKEIVRFRNIWILPIPD
ncbi:MAG: DUF1080 domain-containing protein [Candidatus Methylacidiphilales bacterium]|nr:DUF1080 domain-containing protein [Candidatus Methylacidiphilales bacterium]